MIVLGEISNTFKENNIYCRVNKSSFEYFNSFRYEVIKNKWKNNGGSEISTILKIEYVFEKADFKL